MSQAPPRAPAEEYGERLRDFRSRREAETALSRRLGWVRLATVLTAVGFLLWAVVRASAASSQPWVGAGLAFIIFAVIAQIHDRVIRRERRLANLAAIQEEALHRLERRWESLPVPAVPEGAIPQPAPAFARDLDLFGPGSLFQLLGTVATPPGRQTLARWLLEPAEPTLIHPRQEAVRELAGRLDLRQDLQVRSRGMEQLEARTASFLAWAEGEPWILRRPAVLWSARLLGLAATGSLAAWLGGLVPIGIFLLALMAGYGLSHFLPRPGEIFARLALDDQELSNYANIFALLSETSFDSPLLDALHRDLEITGLEVHREMARLHRLVEWSNLRLSSLHSLIQSLTLWDFHILHRMELWQQRCGPHVRRWLEVLGEIEALAALAALAHDHPSWCYPEMSTAAPARLEARGLGHPLLASAVANDVTVGPEGSFLLVTGSNMSGKSTLLRALGTNVVLAQAGGPAFADELRLPPLVLGTSILVEDSLQQGVSFFMAELQRLKAIVDLADGCGDGERRLLYLLDEVLRGTNSEERQTAVRRVLLHLLDRGALGAVSTHDLQLAELPGLDAACRPVHFRETVRSRADGRPQMTFDYRLRQGVATTRNAMKLLELVGLAR